LPAKTLLVDPGACVSRTYDKDAEQCKGTQGEKYNTVRGDRPEQRGNETGEGPLEMGAFPLW